MKGSTSTALSSDDTHPSPTIEIHRVSSEDDDGHDELEDDNHHCSTKARSLDTDMSMVGDTHHTHGSEDSHDDSTSSEARLVSETLHTVLDEEGSSVPSPCTITTTLPSLCQQALVYAHKGTLDSDRECSSLSPPHGEIVQDCQVHILQQALERYQHCLNRHTREAPGSPEHVCNLHYVCGRLCQRLGRISDAIQHVQDELAVLPGGLLVMDCHVELAHLYRWTQPDLSLVHYRQALKQALQWGDVETAQDIRRHMGRIHYQQGHWERAIQVSLE